MQGLLIRAWCAIVCVMATTSAFAQIGYDRPGGDYSNFPVRAGDPATCAMRCEREGRCRAWSFSYPGATGPAAVCYLKSQVTPRVENSCCVSGVKGAGVMQPTGPIEFSIDRTGGDYRSFELPPDPNGAPCAAACEAEGKCRAWTYVRPGYLGASARCFLKSRLTPPRRKPCCVSGVVR